MLLQRRDERTFLPPATCMTVTSPSALIGAPTYSLVVPVFNEETVLPVLLHRLDQLIAKLDGPAEVPIVDDGGTDMAGIVAAGRAKDDPRYRYLALSRNFGHQVAITADGSAPRAPPSW